VEVHAYDHHPDSPDDIKTSWQIVEPLGSTTAIISRILQANKIVITPDEATLMALGIYEDTGAFTFTSTTPQDLRAAAWLLSQGANLNIISSMITRDFTSEELALLKDIITSRYSREIHDITVVIATVSRPNYVPDLAGVVQKVMDSDNIDVFFTLACMEDKIYLVARSRLPQVDVGRLARILGGGGHPSAASATLREVSLETAQEHLLKLLADNIKPRYLARDLMTSPVVTIPPSASIEQAHEIFLRYHINVLPVVEDDQVLGIITGRTVEVALNHSLGPLPVSEYMDSDVETVGPEATLAEVEHYIVQQRRRLLPVIENGRLAGVITRTDLLQHLLDNPYLPEYSPYALEKLEGARRHDVQKLLAERVSRGTTLSLRRMGELAAAMGSRVYLVGGVVRDIIMRLPNQDLDIVFEGDAIEFARRFAAGCPGITVKENPKFATAKLFFRDQPPVDLASARLEYYQSPAALPEVRMSSIKLDLYRRDFTINTLAIHLNPDQYGTLIDFFDGMHDIKEGVIRVLHNLSFVEDPTRIFRAVRFENRLGFKMSRQTEAVIRNALRLDVLDNLSADRLCQELKRILELDEPSACLSRLGGFKLLQALHPALRMDPGQKELLQRQEEVLSWYHLSFLSTPVRNWVYYAMGLLAPLDDPALETVLARLRLPPKIGAEIRAARRQRQHILNQAQRNHHLPPSKIYDLLKDLKLESQLFIMAGSKQETIKRAVSGYLTTWSKVRTEISGKDLLNLGFAPGVGLGAVKKRILEARLDGVVRSREEELFLAKEELRKASA
jgi:tRNA nucleotidyltransferase (CCA-adding enzyme)